MIETRNLVKRFGKVVALDNVSVRIGEGVTLIMGPNGSGKSTFLRVVAGLYRPTSGQVRVFGGNPWRDVEVLKKIGVSLDPPAFPGLVTGREWLTFLARARGTEGEVERVAGLLDIDYLDEKIRNYSSGMRKRLSLAQALLGEPPLILLDEPLSTLDLEGMKLVVGILKRLKGRTNMVVVSHLWEPIYPLVDRVLVISAGRVVVEGDARELEGRIRAIFTLRNP